MTLYNIEYACTCPYKANDICDKMKSREGVIHYICCEMGLRAQHQTRILITIDRSFPNCKLLTQHGAWGHNEKKYLIRTARE